MRLTTRVGSVELATPILTASGTAGHGAELAPFGDLGALGAVVVKSLSAEAWPGNPAPRLHPTPLGMLNAVGLQGPGVAAWLAEDLAPLAATGARVVASIWGRTVGEYAAAAEALAGAPACVVAVEVNLSCPNLEGRRGIFAHDPALSAEVLVATAACGRPRWAKLSPNTDRIVEVAGAVAGAGAEAVTLVNTLLGMVIDTDLLRPQLAGVTGGLSGPAVRPVAVRALWQVTAAMREGRLRTAPLIGVGGVRTGRDALELVAAGASAVQVGTATFNDPSAPRRVVDELEAEVERHGFHRFADVVGIAHDRTVRP